MANGPGWVTMLATPTIKQNGDGTQTYNECAPYRTGRFVTYAFVRVVLDPGVY